MSLRTFSTVSLLAISVSLCPADETAETDDLASEFRDARFVVLNSGSYGDGVSCTLYTDAEYKQVLERDKGKPKTQLGRKRGYLLLEVKRDRLILMHEENDRRSMVTVLSLRHVSEVHRAASEKERGK